MRQGFSYTRLAVSWPLVYGVRMDHDAQLAELAKLFSNLSPAQLAEAAENLDAYLQIALRVWERIENDPKAYALFEGDLAGRRKDGTQS